MSGHQLFALCRGAEFHLLLRLHVVTITIHLCIIFANLDGRSVVTVTTKQGRKQSARFCTHETLWRRSACPRGWYHENLESSSHLRGIVYARRYTAATPVRHSWSLAILRYTLQDSSNNSGSGSPYPFHERIDLARASHLSLVERVAVAANNGKAARKVYKYICQSTVSHSLKFLPSPLCLICVACVAVKGTRNPPSHERRESSTPWMLMQSAGHARRETKSASGCVRTHV